MSARNERRVTSSRATGLVISRELHEAFRRRSLWIIFGILFVGSCVAMVLPDLLDEGSTHYDVAIVTSSGDADAFVAALRPVIHAQDSTVSFGSVDSVAAAKKLVDDGKVDVAAALGDTPVVITRSGENDTLVAASRQAIASNMVAARLRAEGVDPAAVAVTPARIVAVDVDDADRRAAVFVLSIVVYLVLLLLMTSAATGVAIEKSNRISEVLLAVVKPGALLFGKVIGVGIVGLTGMLVAALPVVVKAAAGGDLPAGLGPALGAALVWFVLGLGVYLTIAGALGALVERQEEAGSVIAPLSILLVATYIFAQSAADSGFGTFLAIFPLTSPLVMPARIALGNATTAEIVASLLVGIATVFLTVRVGGAIYRRGIVHTGRRLRLREVFRAS